MMLRAAATALFQHKAGKSSPQFLFNEVAKLANTPQLDTPVRRHEKPLLIDAALASNHVNLPAQGLESTVHEADVMGARALHMAGRAAVVAKVLALGLIILSFDPIPPTPLARRERRRVVPALSPLQCPGPWFCVRHATPLLPRLLAVVR